jgi:hypothetical protein
MLTQIAEAYDTAVWTGFDRVPRAEVRVMPDQVLQLVEQELPVPPGQGHRRGPRE